MSKSDSKKRDSVRQRLVLPDNCIDVTAQELGKVTVVIGGRALSEAE